MLMRTLTAVVYKEKDIYVAECPEVGTVSQGYTIEEAVANLKEATELYLEEFPLNSTLQKTAGSATCPTNSIDSHLIEAGFISRRNR